MNFFGAQNSLNNSFSISMDIRTSLSTATVYISIYFGIPMLIIGVLGGLLNLVVFLSLKTFRHSSCAFYLIIMSAVNVLILVTGLLSRITISGFSIDWTQTSTFYCKARVYFNQLSILLSLTCICLATIDQYLSTNVNFQWHRKNGWKLARFLVTFFVLIWILHGIPYLFFYNVVFSSKTGKFSCTITSVIFQQYTVYGFLLIFSGTLPLIITFLFGLLSYRNIKQLAYRTTPLVRRESDKQLTTMVLVHVVFDFFTLVPYVIVSIVALDTSLINDPISNAYIQFFRIFSIYLYYLYFVVSRLISQFSTFSSLFVFSVSILHLRLCFGTISTTTFSRFTTNIFERKSTFQCSSYQPNSSLINLIEHILLFSFIQFKSNKQNSNALIKYEKKRCSDNFSVQNEQTHRRKK